MTPTDIPPLDPDPLTPPALPPAARPRLLVVDDQPINIQVLYQAFHEDHEVFMALSGEQALAFCTQEAPDLILLDVVMPDLDGLEVCRRLKADPATADTPIIFVTAQSDPVDETRALEAGGVDFITKPVNPAVVRARVRTHLTLKAQSDMLRSLAFIDGLTGVANRRRFNENLHTEWRACRRRQTPLALIMIDIDHFKRYNDTYGHQAGDACLRTVGALLRESLGRPHDLVARYGGEEFVCLLPDCDAAGARAKAEILRQAVEQRGLPHAGSATATVVTISLGVAACVPAAEDVAGNTEATGTTGAAGAAEATAIATPEALLLAADAALYAAKRDGRNRVGNASSLPAG